MKFETKFNKDDHAWYMKDNKPTEVVISSIKIFYVGTNQDHIKYTARNVRHSVTWLDHQDLFENILFKTKEELLNNLFGRINICKGRNCRAINGIDHSPECRQDHDQCYVAIMGEIPGFEGTREDLKSLGSK